ncbi:kinase-like domain-containing protein [Verticillium dahliae]|nr:kinase-like domain-containing protein [Verticillium dahliae]
MASTIVGKSGRASGDESFVLKRVPRPFYDLSLRLAAEFAGSRRLRMHVDYPGFPLSERKKILRRVVEVIQELYAKGWMHTDVKPDNILVNWTCDKEGNKIVTDVALGDFDIASKSVTGQPRQTPFAIGNVIIYALGGGEFLLLNNYQELVKLVNSEAWRKALELASKVAEEAVKEQAELRFERWGEELGAEALNMISGVTNLDPTARTAIEKVLAHGWWQGTI